MTQGVGWLGERVSWKWSSIPINIFYYIHKKKLLRQNVQERQQLQLFADQWDWRMNVYSCVLNDHDDDDFWNLALLLFFYTAPKDRQNVCNGIQGSKGLSK